MKNAMRWALPVVLAATWAAAACVPTIKEPDVRLAGVRLGGLGLQGGLLYIRLSVVNPNRFALVADGFSYDLDLSDPADGDDGWMDIASGRFEEDTRVGANDSTVVEIPVEFRYSGVGGALRSLIATGTFNYKVSGRILVDSPLRTEIPYRHRGTVSLTDSD